MKQVHSTAIHAAIFWIALLALAAWRVQLQSDLPVFARSGASHDDMLLVQYADAWLSGKAWGPYLGPKAATALEKLPGFSLFLAAGNLLRLSFTCWLGLAWTAVCFIALVAVRPLLPCRPAALAVFAWLLFCPAMFDVTAQRLYCMGLVTPVALLLAASCLALVLRRDRPFGRRLPWFAATAAALGFYGVLRADAAWALALAGGTAALLAGSAIASARSGRLRGIRLAGELLALALPFLAYTLASDALRAYNRSRYGTFAKSDFTETGFADACLALMSIRPDREEPLVYVSRQSLERAFAASPSLKRLQPAMERFYRGTRPDKGNDIETGMLPNREFQREYYAWRLRWAAAAEGIYGTGSTAADLYFRSVAEELDAAFREERLPRRNALLLSPFTGPLDGRRFIRILGDSLRRGLPVVVFRRGLAAALPNIKDGPTVQTMRRIARQDIPFKWCDTEFVRIRGFLVPAATNQTVSISVVDGKGSVYRPNVLLRTLPGSATPTTPYVDFALTPEIVDLHSASASLRLDGEEVWTGPVEALPSVDLPGLRADAVATVQHVDHPPILPRANRSVRHANRILRVGRTTAFLIPIAALLHLWLGIRLHRRRNPRRSDPVLWLFATGLALAAWSVLFLVSANFFEVPGDYPSRYVMAAYPMLDLFVAVAILAAIRHFRNGDGRETRYSAS